MKYVPTLYQKIFEDKSRIKQIAMDMGLSEEDFSVISEISDRCTDYLLNMWKTGQKVSRTGYVMEAMGKHYPKSESVIESSILTDTIINNLDEIYDENLSKEKRTPHIIELIKEIGKIVENPKLTQEQRNIIGTYFDKILVVAGGEVTYSKLIENSKNEDDILKFGKKYYDSRIIDMDVYVELALDEMGYKDNENNDIVRAAKNFRAINLIRKDLEDIPEDIKNGIKSLFTIVKKRDMKPKEYARKIANQYLKDFNNIQFKDEKLEEIKNNFYKMSQEEMEII